MLKTERENNWIVRVLRFLRYNGIRLRLFIKENHIEGYLNGRKYLDCKDDTFQDAGGVGLWTKADAVTYFDDFKVTLSGK